MKKENEIEAPLKGPDTDFRKMFGLGLSLILGVSLAVSSLVTIIIFLVFYISNLLA
jgi:hypothetical protein